MRWLRFAPLLLVLLVPALAHAATTAQVTANTSGASVYFAPSEVDIADGDSVHWTQASGTHGVIFDAPGSTALPKSGSDLGTRMFPTDGTFAYHCTIHGSAMVGTVVVGTGITPQPTPTPTPTTTATPTATATATATAKPGTTPTATATAKPGTTPTATPTAAAGPGTTAPTTTTTTAATSAKLGAVARHLKGGRLRGTVTVTPKGKSFTVTVRARGARAGRAHATATGKPQAFAIRLSTSARRRLADAGRLKVSVKVSAGTAGAGRTLQPLRH